MIMTVVLVFLYYSLSNQQLVSNKTILNQKHNQYHNPAGVDYGAPTWKLTKKSAYNNVQVEVGPNIENFEKEILQTMQVGLGPNMEADGKVSLQYQ
ncbi:nitrogen regulation protein NIFR3 [Staphylococcus aureus]|nr:nitrogen regulation protein NIFR3 [Staphylococcus aureus]